MKRYGKLGTSLAGVMLLAAAMSGCGGSSDSASTSTSTTAAAPAAGASADKAYTIGICQLVQHNALDAATQGFEDKLTELLGDKVTFDLQNAQGDSATCATIANTFVSNGYDLMLGNATAALAACANASDTIPVLGTSITSFAAALDMELTADNCTGTNVTGTSDLAPLDKQAEQLMTLCPDAKNVGVLYCSAEVNSVYQAEHIKPFFEEKGITVTEYTFSDSNDLQAVAQSAVEASDAIYIPTDNTAASNMSLIDNLARPAKVAVVVGDEGMCANGGLAAYSIDFYSIGQRAGEMAYDILVNGADPGTIPIEDSQGLEAVYNAEVAADLGITMPEGYKVYE